MKKVIWLFLSLTLICIFTFSSCEENNDVPNNTDYESDTVTESSTTPPIDPKNCEHVFGEWTVTKEATCARVGKSTRACSLCSKTEEKTIAKNNNHTEVIDKAVAATCGKDGLTKGSHCSTCNKTIIEQNVIPKTHDHYFSGTSTTCSNCNLKVFAQGDLTDTVFWCISGDEWEYKNIEITVFGKGDIPNFTPQERPIWTSYLDYAEKINIGSGITSIGNYAFYSKYDPQHNPPCEFNMSDTVKTIKSCAILMNLKDGGLILGKGVQTIESIAIENVKKIYIPKSVKQIDSDFFSAFEICVYEGTKAEFCNINRYDIFTGKSTSIKETLQEHPKYFDNYPLYINAKDISDTSHSWTN